MVKWTGFIVLLLIFSFSGVCHAAKRDNLWDRMCAACHDGTTVLNGKVVIGKEQIKAKYRSVDELANAVSCNAPPCMNILKHDEKLVRSVGRELGLTDVRRR